MENAGKEVYYMKVVPLVRTEKIMKKGKLVSVKVDNLSNEERRNMSCDPRMLWENKEHTYFAEMPITFKQGTGVLGTLYYIFGELTLEEQEKYDDRSILIPTTIEGVVQVYNEASKTFFSKKKNANNVSLTKNKTKKRTR